MAATPASGERSQGRGALATIRRVLGWLLARLLLFLELIGLRRRPLEDPTAQLARLRLHHTEFRKLLSANDAFLTASSELERRLYGGEPCDRPFLERRAVEASVAVFRMVSALQAIGGERFQALGPAFDRISARIQSELATPEAAPAERPLTLELDRCRADAIPLVGGKLANLGELRAVLGLPTPDGFVVTVAAFERCLDACGREPLRSELLSIFSAEDVPRVAATLGQRIREAGVPPAVREAILEAYDALAARLGAPPRVAVRSSAVEEDGVRSFAGQFLSLLGVDRGGLVDAYLAVVASLYSAEAVHYRHQLGLSGESAAMAVGVIAMVDAEVSGIAYSREPTQPGSHLALIQAVSGLGVSLADGAVVPLTLSCDPSDAEAPVVRRAASAAQGQRVVLASEGGTRVEAGGAGAVALDDERTRTLASWARRLEEHFGSPQDVEWALDRAGALSLLQSRPLRVASAAAAAAAPHPAARLLCAGGETAFPGVGAGPAVVTDEEGDLDTFPAGAVLVAPRSSPRFVRVMGRAAAIVTDLGSTTGHMASLARELGVPTLLGVGEATASIPAGELCTVDARSGHVYAGRVEELLEEDAASRPPRAAELQRGGGGGVRDLLARVAEPIVPLHLTDPRSAEFTPASCRTLHDLARFIHEKSYEEMFGLGGKLGDARSIAYQLDVFLPIDLYLIDLGGGLAPSPRAQRTRRIRPAELSSRPLAALVRGLLHPKIPGYGPRAMDARGLFSIMMRHAVTNPEEEQTFRDPCYALVSDHYLNYTARVGYHFGVVDAYCGPSANRNYVNLHFRGGAADLLRRARRARLIAGILRALGLHTTADRDVVTARLGRSGEEETLEALDQIGRMLQFVRQLDVAMVSDEAVSHYREAFLREDYALEQLKKE